MDHSEAGTLVLVLVLAVCIAAAYFNARGRS